MLTTTATQAQPLYAERHRPQFHFTSTADWINDPNGLVFFDGEYHLYFQRTVNNLDGNAPKAWGRAFSRDLVHWQQTPEDALPADEAGAIWSGSAVVDWKNTSGFGVDGKPPLIAFYTNARDPFDQRLAYSRDNGRTWTKVAQPILPNVHGRNRDPKVIWHEPSQRWVMALYLDQRHRFALYNSANLREWMLLHELTIDGDDECPDFFPLNLDGDPNQQMWIFTGANGRYVIGSFDGRTFTPQSDSLPSDHGPGSFYAAQTYSDIPTADGRRIQIGWLRGEHLPAMPFNQQLSFPCELKLNLTRRGPRLFRWPVRENESLYAERREARDIEMPPGHNVLASRADELFDVTLLIEPRDARTITLDVYGQRVTYHVETATGGALTAWDRRVSLPLNDDGQLSLRVLVDRTSIEIFANGGSIVLSGCYRPQAEHPIATLVSDGGTARASLIQYNKLNSAWPQ